MDDANKNALSGTILTSDKGPKTFLIRPYIQMKGQISGYFLSKTSVENGAPKRGFWRQFMDNNKKKYVRSDTGNTEFHS